MDEDSVLRPLSEAVSEGISKVYKLGGLALTFVFSGTVLLIVAVVLGEGVVAFVIAAVGATLILAVVVLFYQQDIRRLRDARNAVASNAELIDTVQQTAVNMTEFALDLQALSFKYAHEIADFIATERDEVRQLTGTPPLSLIPGMSKLAERLVDDHRVLKASDLSASIVKMTESAKTIIEEVNLALVNADPTALKKYLAQIRQLDDSVRGLLATS